MCQIHGDNASGYRKLGLFAGTAVNARFNERVSLELGFYFSQKGSRRNPTKDDPTYFRIHLNYVDMPLSLRIMASKNYFITLGPSIAYLISYKVDYNYSDYSDQNKFNAYEVGLNIGLGRKLHKNLDVEVRCSNSISPVLSYGVASTVFYPNPVARFFNKGLYSNMLTVLFSYKLDLKKKTVSSEP